MQRRFAAENLGQPVARVVVQERPAAFKLVLEARNPPTARSLILVILSAHSETDPVSGGHHDGGWPDLDVKLDYLARSQRLLFVVGVIRPVGRAQFRIELAMQARSQP